MTVDESQPTRQRTGKGAPVAATRDGDELLARRAELERAVELALEEAARRGADAAEAGASMGEGLSATVRMGEVETMEFHRDRGMGVTVFLGQRRGSVSTADISEAAVRDAVERAVSIARYTADDPFAGLADAGLMATEIPDLDLYHPWDLSPQEAVDLARRCEDAARESDRRIANSEGASCSSGAGLEVYGNSHGFLGGFPSSNHSIGCSVVARDEVGMERDHWYTASRASGDLEDAVSVGRRAAERTVRRLGSRRLSTRRCPVLFPAELARGFLGHGVAALRGSAQYRQSSFLLDAVGEQIFPDWVDMVEHPHIPRGMASAPFDDEGVATRDRPLVVAGRVERYILSSYSARKLGLESTANAGGLHNLDVVGGEGDLADLMARMGTGFLVTELIGQGVNPVTGDYSRGAAGFWVEGGEIAHPVSEVTLAADLRQVYGDLVAIGDDRDLRGGIRCGSLLVAEMTLAGE